MQPVTVELLRDILREAEFLSVQAAQTNRDAFLQHEVLKRAFVRSVEVIGEATKRCRKKPGPHIRQLSGRKWRVCATGSYTIMAAWIT